MKITGQNVLEEMNNLIGKEVRIITLEEEALYGTGYVGKIEDIKKRYWEKGHYNVYDIIINLKGYEKINRINDNHSFDGGKAYLDMDFYDEKINYSICTNYEKYELEFEEDKEKVFFEILEKPTESK